MLGDSLADFLTRIRNASKAQLRYVDIPLTNLNQAVAEILKENGLIENFIVKNEKPQGTMRVFLKYKGRNSVINGIKRISKPGLRKYVGYQEIPYFFGGLGVAILSTSQGVLAGSEANKRKIGGELLCLAW